jgi:type VI protein secretion system component Hcp
MQHPKVLNLGIISDGLSPNQFFLVKLKNLLIVILTRNTCKMIQIGNEKVTTTELMFEFITISYRDTIYQHMLPK